VGVRDSFDKWSLVVTLKHGVAKMPNTAQETNDAINAFTAIVILYGDSLDHSRPFIRTLTQVLYDKKRVMEIENYIKFQDEQAFSISLTPLGKKMPKPEECKTRGFTADAIHGTGKVVYICRPYSKTTIIHELLHAFAHPEFRNSVELSLNEAITEYFTQKVIHKNNPVKSKVEFDMEERKNVYVGELSSLMKLRQSMKSHSKPTGYMKKAYFKGDPEALRYLKEEHEYVSKPAQWTVSASYITTSSSPPVSSSGRSRQHRGGGIFKPSSNSD
jgi:hypothetical protein